MGENGKTRQRSLRGIGSGGRAATALAAVALALGLVACGGDAERQDANEPEGDFPVKVGPAKFPTHQRLADENDLELRIENAGDQAIPNLAVTIWTGEQKADGSFNILMDAEPASPDDPALANPSRPVWILETGYPKLLTPGLDRNELDDAPSAGAVAAHTDTFQFGALPAGEGRTIVWRVTPVRPGTYTVHYEIAAGLQGKARATQNGGQAEGEFLVTISKKPPQTCVDENGQVRQRGDCGF